MTDAALWQPDATEYLSYYGKYIQLVPEGHVLDTLERQIGDTIALLRTVDAERAGYRYAPGKWSVREVIGHLTDTERVFAYRALRFARNDQTPLPGFDENTFVANSNYDRRPLADVAEEMETVRTATVCLFRSLPSEALTRRGTANNAEMSVRAVAWILAGHELHHVGLLKERYLGA
jgi:hypothetical protein